MQNSNYILEVQIGDTLDYVIDKINNSFMQVPYGTYEFEFNGVKCLMNKDTNPEWLKRDYLNAHIMEWDTVGPLCVESYSPEIENELQGRIQKRNEKNQREQAQYDAKCNAEKKSFVDSIEGVIMEFKDETMWLSWKEKNTDPYGACVYEYAEGWAKLMQIEISKGISVAECASPTSYKLGFLGITGFMYGAAVSVLSHCWKHGEELRVWHNKEYNHMGDGIVNPAVITLS